MNLREKLRSFEKRGILHDQVHDTLFGTDSHEDASKKVDEKFKLCLKEWRERKSPGARIGANILIYMMAIMDTRDYRRQRDELDELAAEIDCNYTPEELLQYLEPDLIPYKLRNDRMKTRVRKGMLEAEFQKDEHLATFLRNYYVLISKE